MKKNKSIKEKIIQAKDGMFKLSVPKKIIIASCIIVIAFFISKQFTKKSSIPQYQTATVEKGDIISTLSESGNVTAVSQTSIESTTDGIIEEEYVKNGDVVQAGENLFKVKSTATPQEKASAYASYLSSLNNSQSAQQSKQSLQAQLEQARASVINAQIAVDQMNNNITNGVNNPSTKQAYTQNDKDAIESALTSGRESFTATETKYKQADTSISAASSNQSAAWLEYEATQDSVITAPIAGTVANFSARVGSNVSGSSANSTSTNSSSSSSSNSSSSSSSTTSSGVLVIGDFSQLSITAQVNEIDVPKIKAGQKATVTLDAFPDKTFVGTMDSIDTIGTSSSGVVTYNAYISLVSPPSDIQSGMTASVVIQTDRKDNVIKIPTTAVQTLNGEIYVRVLKNGQMSQVSVVTGLSDDTDTEIVSGLSEGQTIITSVATTTSTTQSGSQGTSPFSSFGGARGGFGGGAGFTRTGGGR